LEEEMKKTFLSVGISVLLISLVVGCASKPKEESVEPEREGVATILENPVHPDGVYEIDGGITIQFLGETWIQMKDGAPVAAGKLEGVLAAPPGFSADPSASGGQQMEDFMSSVTKKEGDITLKGTLIYMSGKWHTLEEAKKLNRVPLKKNEVISQDIEDLITAVEKGLVLHYQLIETPPFITVTKK
jgi:hypothetical protein